MSLDSSISTLSRLKARRPKYRGSSPGWGKRYVSSIMHTAGSVPGGRKAGPEADHSAIQCRYYFCMTLFKLHKKKPPISSVYLLPQNWSLFQPDRRICTNTVRHCTSTINDTVHDFTKRHYQMVTLFSFTLFYNENQNDVVWLAFKWSAPYQLSYVLRRETKLRAEDKTGLLSGPLSESKHSLNSSNLKMEAMGSNGMLVRIHQLIWNQIRCEGLKSSNMSFNLK